MSQFLKTSLLVDDVRTDIIIQPFADRTLVLVTQLGKVGSLVHSSLVWSLEETPTNQQPLLKIQASLPSTTHIHHDASSDSSDYPRSLPRPSAAVQLTPIFGSAPTEHMQTLHSLYAAQIATLIWLSPGIQYRNVIVGIALRKPGSGTDVGELSEEDRRTFYGIMDALQVMLT